MHNMLPKAVPIATSFTVVPLSPASIVIFSDSFCLNSLISGIFSLLFSLPEILITHEHVSIVQSEDTLTFELEFEFSYDCSPEIVHDSSVGVCVSPC